MRSISNTSTAVGLKKKQEFVSVLRVLLLTVMSCLLRPTGRLGSGCPNCEAERIRAVCGRLHGPADGHQWRERSFGRGTYPVVNCCTPFGGLFMLLLVVRPGCVHKDILYFHVCTTNGHQ